jgi:hypothetical protein
MRPTSLSATGQWKTRPLAAPTPTLAAANQIMVWTSGVRMSEESSRPLQCEVADRADEEPSQRLS